MLQRLTGTYLGFEALKKELEPLSGPQIAIQKASEAYADVMLAAKKDTCDLHYLIQEFVKIYRVAKHENKAIFN